jgi:DNA-binding transcriptional LysR family regulator
MNLDRLATFRVLAEMLHFRRAADKLRLSQSAVSQQIAALERELGTALFERIGRRVYLTPAGEVLRDEAAKVLSALARAHEAVLALGTGDTGRLRVGASTTPGIYLLPEVLGQFRKSMPKVQLEFRIANSRDIEASLLANELDLGVVGNPVEHDELFATPMGQDQVIAVASPSLLGKTRRVTPAELSRFPLFSREGGSATRSTVDQALSKLGIKLSLDFALPSPEACLRAAASGLGVTFVSRYAAAPQLKAKRLVELNVVGLSLVRPLSAAYHRDKRVTPAMRALMSLLKDHLKAAKVGT